jgi:hypothetical protein
VLEQVKELFANQPGRPKPLINTPAPEPLRVNTAAIAASASEVDKALPPKAGEHAARANGSGLAGEVGSAALNLVSAGLAFLQSISAELNNGSSAGGKQPTCLSNLFSHDGKTKRPILSIPLPASFTPERLGQAVSQLLNTLLAPPTISQGRALPQEVERETAVQ